MVSSMLEISSIDCGFVRLKYEDVEFTELCNSVIRDYAPLMQDYRVAVHFCDSAMVSGDRKYLEQVIKNLLNNAVEHTKAGDSIEISVEKQENMVTFSIRNQGDPIPETDLEHLWDAFYRTDKARTRDGKNNVGLRLYIVKTIVEKHGGLCRIANVDDGVTASVTLKCI